MLRYLNRGIRIGPNPQPPGRHHGNWEFFAVVRGSIRLVYPGKAATRFERRRFWLLPPESPHTWATPPASSCQMFVFHFATIHPLLESSLPGSRTLSIPLTDADAKLLSGVYQELVPHYHSPRLASAAHFEAAMLRLCTLFLEHDATLSSPGAFDAATETILRAVRWHRAHLADGVRVNDVAAALNLSPGHLRRLFLRIRNESPKRVFGRTMVEEACRLMAQGTLSLKEVGVRCGFSGFSEFYRAFKNQTGMSPSDWRRNRVYQGVDPRLVDRPPVGIAG